MKWGRLIWDHRFLQMMLALYIPSLRYNLQCQIKGEWAGCKQNSVHTARELQKYIIFDWRIERTLVLLIGGVPLIAKAAMIIDAKCSRFSSKERKKFPISMSGIKILRTWVPKNLKICKFTNVWAVKGIVWYPFFVARIQCSLQLSVGTYMYKEHFPLG